MKPIIILFLSALLILPSFRANANCKADSIELTVRTQNFDPCEGDGLIFMVIDVVGNPEGIFTWSKIGGTLPPGMLQQSTLPFNSTTSSSLSYNGLYKVVYTDQNGCTSVAKVKLALLPKPIVNVTQETYCYGVKLTALEMTGKGRPYTFNWIETGETARTINYTGAGGMGSNRTVEIINKFGCSGSGFSLQLFPVPLSISIDGKYHIHAGDTIFLNALSNYPVAEYQWYANNVSLVNAVSPQLMVTDTGLYKVRIKSTDGCIKFIARRITYFLNRMANPDLEYSSDLSIYPNPATSVLHIAGHEPGEIRIIDLTGKICMRFNSTEPAMDISVETLIPGIYFLKSGDRGLRFIKL